MVGFSASWNVIGLVSGLALISSDWLVEMKSTLAFFVCSLIAICTCAARPRSEEHTSELQSRFDLVCRLLLEKKKTKKTCQYTTTLNHKHITSPYLHYYLILSSTLLN